MHWQLTLNSTWESSEGKGLPHVCSCALWASSYKIVVLNESICKAAGLVRLIWNNSQWKTGSDKH